MKISKIMPFKPKTLRKSKTVNVGDIEEVASTSKKRGRPRKSSVNTETQSDDMDSHPSRDDVSPISKRSKKKGRPSKSLKTKGNSVKGAKIESTVKENVKWTDEEEKKFASLWRSHPFLYTSSMPEYAHGKLRKQTWQIIASEMNRTVQDIKRHTSSMRTVYRKLLKRHFAGENMDKSKRFQHLRSCLSFLPMMEGITESDASDSDEAQEGWEVDTGGGMEPMSEVKGGDPVCRSPSPSSRSSDEGKIQEVTSPKEQQLASAPVKQSSAPVHDPLLNPMTPLQMLAADMSQSEDGVLLRSASETAALPAKDTSAMALNLSMPSKDVFNQSITNISPVVAEKTSQALPPPAPPKSSQSTTVTEIQASSEKPSNEDQYAVASQASTSKEIRDKVIFEKENITSSSPQKAGLPEIWVPPPNVNTLLSPSTPSFNVNKYLEVLKMVEENADMTWTALLFRKLPRMTPIIREDFKDMVDSMANDAIRGIWPSRK